MVSDVALFWAVLAGFLCLDNLVLLPAGADYLRFNRRGRWIYEPGLRMQARQRDLIFLNPINPFHRLVQTDCSIGDLTPQSFRSAGRQLRRSLRHINLLSLVGSSYLVILTGLAAASLWLNFGDVLLALVLTHFIAWSAAMVVLARNHSTLCASRFRAISLAFESLVMPGYLVNLGKRVCIGQTFSLPALVIGLRQLAEMPSDTTRELYAAQMSRRLDELAVDFNVDIERSHPMGETLIKEQLTGNVRLGVERLPGESSSSDDVQQDRIKAWFKQARQCLASR